MQRVEEEELLGAGRQFASTFVAVGSERELFDEADFIVRPEQRADERHERAERRNEFRFHESES